MQRQVPRQVLSASMILFSRCGDEKRLLEFLKWKTAADKEDLDRWARGVTKWKEQADEHVCKLYTDGSATLNLRRAAAQVAKFTVELSLHSWMLHHSWESPLTRLWFCRNCPSMDWRGSHGMQWMHIGRINVPYNFCEGGGEDGVFEKARFQLEKK